MHLHCNSVFSGPAATLVLPPSQNHHCYRLVQGQSYKEDAPALTGAAAYDAAFQASDGLQEQPVASENPDGRWWHAPSGCTGHWAAVLPAVP